MIALLFIGGIAVLALVAAKGGLMGAPVEKRLAALEPETRARVAQLLFDCKARGVELMVLETKRSRERQEELFAQGRTAPGKIVTWTKESSHLDGTAVDLWPKGVSFSDNAKATKILLACGEIARELGLAQSAKERGDFVHFQKV